MRIVIDLQSCQQGAPPEALALAQDLARSAGEHQVWIALSGAGNGAARIEALRAAFAPLLARERVRVFDLPETGPAGAGWRLRAAELVRDNFLAGLDPDVVFLPHPFGGAGVVCGPPAAHAAFDTVWGKAGAGAAAAWRRLAAAAGERSRPPVGAAPRARLAYVSPLPPEKSGIADYSAELVPQLARFYDVELIAGDDGALDRVDKARLGPGVAVHGLDWFERHAHEFERVLYHFGNSHAHKHMFGMVRRHPGIVVLHDFFFSGVLDNLEREGYLAQAFLQALYESHGYSGLFDHRRIGRTAAIWKYPVNQGVLGNASGVIVHSEFSRQLAVDWYGPHAADGWRIVPLLRGRAGPGDGTAGAGARAAARRRLRLKGDDFLICSFGMLGRTKLNEELLDAFLGSRLAADPHCKLVFVGQNEAGIYGAALERKIGARSGAPPRVAITGFVGAATYADYLAACDIAVQLRSATRGETSAAVLDCLLHGAPTIVNAHGANAALGAELLVKLPDRFTIAQLGVALEKLHADARLRAGLSQRAQAYMQAEHAPARVGQLYRDAIEHFTLHSPRNHYRALLGALARLPGALDAPAPELAGLARAIAFNQPPAAPRQLLVDVSAVVQSDLKTGIQRVVRSVLLALVEDPPPGYRIEPVFSTGANRSYRYARRFTLGMLGLGGAGQADAPALEDAPAELRPGDVFLGLDLFTNGTSQNQALLQSMHARGIEIHFVVFDILPMRLPHMFPFGTEQHFGDFLRTIARVSDGVLCISRAVADELAEWIAAEGVKRAAPLKIAYFHLGADIEASAPTSGLPDNAAQVLASLAARPSFLVVGTVEPRKGHAQALAAFELLWERGQQVNLVVVGKQGWMVDKLAERMAQHPERQRRLFWLPGVSDEMLKKLYAGSAALLAPSVGEGFGLPLIEAAQHNLPVIARDLPVFREVAGQHAYYFEGLEARDLAGAIEAWLRLQREGRAPPSGGMAWLTWREAAQQLVDAVLHRQWYREVPATTPEGNHAPAHASE